jgi:hypothetical protein
MPEPTISAWRNIAMPVYCDTKHMAANTKAYSVVTALNCGRNPVSIRKKNVAIVQVTQENTAKLNTLLVLRLYFTPEKVFAKLQAANPK